MGGGSFELVKDEAISRFQVWVVYDVIVGIQVSWPIAQLDAREVSPVYGTARGRLHEFELPEGDGWAEFLVRADWSGSRVGVLELTTTRGVVFRAGLWADRAATNWVELLPGGPIGICGRCGDEVDALGIYVV